MKINGVDLHVTDTQSGAPAVVFSHGLLFSNVMFDPQIAALRDRYRCVAFDHRGQGQSEVTKTGYDMDTLTDDAAALIEQLGIGPCHFVGLSMGGFVGMRLAIHRPELLKSLTLIETSADAEPKENHFKYRMLNFIARWFGLGAVTGRVMPIMFGQSFLNDPARAQERAKWRAHIASGDRTGVTRAVNGVVDRDAVFDQLGRITTPTLIIVGEEDVATVPEKSERMHRAIPGAQLVRIPRAGHSATLEEPAAVTAALTAFLQTIDS
ncbi:MAG: 3-oxoadipate enol-lactonase [Paracoccaceae bacterium]|jgi:3-oxoadipate enol-lactonase